MVTDDLTSKITAWLENVLPYTVKRAPDTLNALNEHDEGVFFEYAARHERVFRRLGFDVRKRYRTDQASWHPSQSRVRNIPYLRVRVM